MWIYAQCVHMHGVGRNLVTITKTRLSFPNGIFPRVRPVFTGAGLNRLQLNPLVIPCNQSTTLLRTNLSTNSSSSSSGFSVTSVDYRSLKWPLRLVIRFVAGYRDYGLTALTFHAVIAGISVLFWWYLVYNHYDVQGWLARLGFISPFDLLLSRVTQAFGAASFPLAYAIHKATGPLRVLLTLFVTPFMVRSLRKRHIFKLPPGMRP